MILWLVCLGSFSFTFSSWYYCVFYCGWSCCYNSRSYYLSSLFFSYLYYYYYWWCILLVTNMITFTSLISQLSLMLLKLCFYLNLMGIQKDTSLLTNRSTKSKKVIDTHTGLYIQGVCGYAISHPSSVPCGKTPRNNNRNATCIYSLTAPLNVILER